MPNPWESDPAYYESYMQTGDHTAATIASRAARGLPANETRAEVLDRMIVDYINADWQITASIKAEANSAGIKAEEIIYQAQSRKDDYEKHEVRNIAKKFALVAALVVSGFTLGPAIAASLKAGAGAAGVAAGSKAATILPMAQKAFNSARTLKAVADGEAPPPPLSLSGGSFMNWTSSLGKTLLNKEISDKNMELSYAQRAEAEREMNQEIARLQQEAYDLGLMDAAVSSPGLTNPDWESVIAAQETVTAEKTRQLLMIGGAGLAVVVALGLLSRR